MLQVMYITLSNVKYYNNCTEPCVQIERAALFVLVRRFNNGY